MQIYYLFKENLTSLGKNISVLKAIHWNSSIVPKEKFKFILLMSTLLLSISGLNAQRNQYENPEKETNSNDEIIKTVFDSSLHKEKEEFADYALFVNKIEIRINDLLTSLSDHFSDANSFQLWVNSNNSNILKKLEQIAPNQNWPQLIQNGSGFQIDKLSSESDLLLLNELLSTLLNELSNF